MRAGHQALRHQHELGQLRWRGVFVVDVLQQLRRAPRLRLRLIEALRLAQRPPRSVVARRVLLRCAQPALIAGEPRASDDPPAMLAQIDELFADASADLTAARVAFLRVSGLDKALLATVDRAVAAKPDSPIEFVARELLRVASEAKPAR